MPSLTFQPSIDNSSGLKAFLEKVILQYEERKRKILLKGLEEATTRISHEHEATTSSSNEEQRVESGSRCEPPGSSGTEEESMKQGPAAAEKTRKTTSNHAQSFLGEKTVTMKQRKQQKQQKKLQPPAMKQQKKCEVAKKQQKMPAMAKTEEKQDKRAADKPHKRRIYAAVNRSDIMATSPHSMSLSASTAVAKATVTPAAKRPRLELNAHARASLLRAKQLDIHAQDPELLAPPNETETERRRRMERINGRRKRAKKLIEIDQLNEQVLDLTDRNNGLITSNEALKEKTSSLKSALQGQGDLQQAINAATALLLNHDNHENNYLEERKQAPPPQQEQQPEIIGKNSNVSTEQGRHRHLLLQPGSTASVAMQVLSSSSSGEPQVPVIVGGGGGGVRGLVQHQDPSVRGAELLALLRVPPAEAAPLMMADRASRHQGLNDTLGGSDNVQELKSDDLHNQHQPGMSGHLYQNQNPNIRLHDQRLQANGLVQMPQILQQMIELQQWQQQQQLQQQLQLHLILQQLRPTGGLDDQSQATSQSILNFLQAQQSENAAVGGRQPTLD